MYLNDVIRKSKGLNGITRIRTLSGDVLIGKFTTEQDEALIGFITLELKTGGTVHLISNQIESVTLLDNLQMLEELDATTTRDI